MKAGYQPKPVPMVSVDHLHAPTVSVREQAAILVTALRRSRRSTFRALIVDCEGTLLVVARFLALLELYREGAVTFEQVDPLGELHIRWTGTDEGEIEVPDEFEDDAEARAEDDSSTEGRTAENDADDTDDTQVSDHTTIDLRETPSDD